MADFARSASPAVQAQLDRLDALSPGRDVLGLERIAALLARLGNPERALPPVLHVAGTNGKGSTCAALRAALEADGRIVHVYTSPHLVRFNERIRIAGALVSDAALAALLAEVLDAADGIAPSFFEATTAAAFLAFARTPADTAIVEVGLGGRLDATNVLPSPAACGIAQLGLDHQAFLGNSLAGIAAEKAGIAKAGAPLVTLAYPPALAAAVERAAAAAGARWVPQGAAWDVAAGADGLVYRDARGAIALPRTRLPGRHQALNAALAIAMLRHQNRLAVSDEALRAATAATWPARLQRLRAGPVHDLLPASAELWLDGCHNPAAAAAIAAFLADPGADGRPLHLVLGMLDNKDAAGLLACFAPLRPHVHAVPVEDHAHHAPDALAALARALGLAADAHRDVAAALAAVAPAGPPRVLICGSLYLAGTVLASNGEAPA